jgi:hypothetical protein
MKVIKRELYLCVSVTVLVFVCALAWGSPFIGIRSGGSSVFARTHQPTAQNQAKMSERAARQGSGDCFALGIL